MMLLRASLSQRSEIAAITINQNGVAYPEGTFYLLGPDGNPKSGWTLLVTIRKMRKMSVIRWQENEIGLPEQETAEPASPSAKCPQNAQNPVLSSNSAVAQN